MLTNMTVFESPPSESCRKYVSFELRYGTCLSFRASAAMTSPSDDSDLLMFCASFSRSPVASVRERRSEPARSTRCSLEQEPRPVVALWLWQQTTHASSEQQGGAKVTCCFRAKFSRSELSGPVDADGDDEV